MSARTTLTRVHRFGELIDRFPPQDPAKLPMPENLNRYALVERSVYDGMHWITTHERFYCIPRLAFEPFPEQAS